jgi:DUF4097 and DUF4098 domain-containing protein YvlB
VSKKAVLILSLTLLLLGAILFGGAMTMLKWNFQMLSTVKYETNEHEIADAFDSVSVSTDTARVVFEPSEDGRISVVCHERVKAPHTVSVIDGVLSIKLVNERRWYDYIGLDLDTPTVTVKLPLAQYAALTVKSKTGSISVPRGFSFSEVSLRTNTGRISFSASVAGALSIEAGTGAVILSDLSAGSVWLSVSTGEIRASELSVAGSAAFESSTGKIKVTHLSCESLSAELDTGDLTLEDTVASGRLTVETDTGDVRLTRCDAAALDIETDTGDVVGTLLSEKLFDAKSDTGRVRVPAPSGTAPCRIRTDTGSITMEIAR